MSVSTEAATWIGELEEQEPEQGQGQDQEQGQGQGQDQDIGHFDEYIVTWGSLLPAPEPVLDNPLTEVSLMADGELTFEAGPIDVPGATSIPPKCPRLVSTSLTLASFNE